MKRTIAAAVAVSFALVGPAYAAEGDDKAKAKAKAAAKAKSKTRVAWPGEGVTVIDKVVAVVGTDPITLFELLLKAAPFEARLRANAGGGDMRSALLKLRAEVLDSLVNDILIRGEARKMQLEVTQEQIDAHLTQIKEANGWDDEELAEAVKQIGFDSLGDYRRNVKRELLKQQAIGYRVRARVKISESEVKRVLAERLASEGGVEQRRAAHILLKVPEFAPDAEIEAAIKKMNDIRKAAASGETTFEELARKHSQDTNAASGGDLGWLTKGDTDPDFEKVVWQLGKGEVSAPTRTDFGFHLIKLTDVRSKNTLTEDKKQSILRQIRYRMRQKEAARLLDIWMKELRDNVFIQVKDPMLKPLVKSLQGQKKSQDGTPKRP